MKPIEEMTGLELREACAIEVMGIKDNFWSHGEGSKAVLCTDEMHWPPPTTCVVPAYESSIEAAFTLVEKLSTKGYDTCLSNGNGPTFAWDCEMTPKGRDTRKPCVLGQANDPALAIARAALKAVRAK